MKINSYIVGAVSGAISAVVLPISYKNYQISQDVIRSLESDDTLFGLSNAPSIPIWYDNLLRAKIFLGIGGFLLAAGLFLIFFGLWKDSRKAVRKDTAAK